MRRPSLPRRPGLPRRPILIALALLGVVGGGFLLVRDSGFFTVEQVSVSGATGPDAPKIEAGLERAAREMTTLHVRRDRLEKIVASYPTVARLEIDRDLPHALRLRVVELPTVAVIQTGARKIPVTADGRVLTGATPRDDLPVLALKGDTGAKVDDARGERLLELVAAAPRQLRHKAKRAYLGERGLTLTMRDGPSLYFGTTKNLEAKWAAAARVLADPTAEGARYVDVRVPERVAAGGLAPPPSEEDEDPAEVADPAAAAAGTTPVPDPAAGAQPPTQTATEPPAQPVTPPVPSPTP